MAAQNPYQLTSAEQEEIRSWATNRGLDPTAQLNEANQLFIGNRLASANQLRDLVESQMAKDPTGKAGISDMYGAANAVSSYSPTLVDTSKIKAATTTNRTPTTLDTSKMKAADVSGYDPTTIDTSKIGKAQVKDYTPTTVNPADIATAATVKAGVQGYDATGYTSKSYTPETYTAEGYDPTSREYKTYDAKQADQTMLKVTPDQLVEDRIQGLLKKGSPLLTLQETKARQGMAGRGLLSSSMAEGEALRAVTESARDIATSDAATVARAAQINAEQANTLAQFNALQINAAESFNANAANQALSDNQRVINSAAEFLANSRMRPPRITLPPETTRTRLQPRRLTRQALLWPWRQITPTRLERRQITPRVLKRPGLLTLLRPTRQMQLTVPESLTLRRRLKPREPKQLRLTPLRLIWSRRLIVQQSLTPPPKPTRIELKLTLSTPLRGGYIRA